MLGAMYEKGQDAIRLVFVLLPGAQESAIQGFISLHMWADFRKGLDDAAALQRLRAFILGEAPTLVRGANRDNLRHLFLCRSYLLDADTLIFMIRGLKLSNRHQARRERAQKLVDRCRRAQTEGDALTVSAITAITAITVAETGVRCATA